jgi:hypothetical protein
MLIPFQEQLSLARRHSSFDQGLLSRVLAHDRAQAEGQATPEARQLYNMASAVYTEFNFLRCFLRLEVNGKGIVWARHTPEHQVEDMLVAHFAYRFPLFSVALGSARGTFVGRKGDVRRLEGTLEDAIIALEREGAPEEAVRALNDIGESPPDAWKAFYSSQSTRAADRAAMKAAIPRKYLRMGSFSEERKALAGKTLSDFL